MIQYMQYHSLRRTFLSILYDTMASQMYRLNTRQIIRGRGTDDEAKKSPGFQIVTDERSRTHSIPLQTPTVKRDPLDVESCRKEEVCKSSTP